MNSEQMERNMLLEEFVRIHRSQLDALNVPRHLHARLYTKLTNGILDAASVFGIEEYENGKRNCIVIAEEGVEAAQDIYLFDHALSFPDSEVGGAYLLAMAI